MMQIAMTIMAMISELNDDARKNDAKNISKSYNKNNKHKKSR